MPTIYTPDESLPINRTFMTVVIDEVRYKAYFETDWYQVFTEDGVSLYEFLDKLPDEIRENTFRYCGTLQNTPDTTAMDQLYAKTNQKVGDVYLVETDYTAGEAVVCESYVWIADQWVFCGTTNREKTIQRSLPEVMRLFPDELGEPGQSMVVSADGKTITWGKSGEVEVDAKIEEHNTNQVAHQDIRDSINLKSDKLIIYNDTLLPGKWVYNMDYPCFEYIYTSDKLPIGAYFELTPVVNSTSDSRSISSAGISQVFEIKTGENQIPYAILRARRVPDAEIGVCVKVFGTYIEK